MLKSIISFFSSISTCVEIARVADTDIDKARELMRKEFC